MLFKLHPVPWSAFIPAGDLDAQQREIHRQTQGLLQRLAPHQGTYAGGGEEIPRAGKMGIDAAAAVFKEAILRRGIGQHAQFVRAIGDAGQHHVTGAQLRQLPQDIPQPGQVVVLPVGGSRQQACLREIGRHHVRLRRQAGHVAGKILVKARVERSPIGHSRVHEA